MGCSQSKASTDQVVERVSVDTPAAEAPVPESIKTTEPEPAVETPPASADEFPPAPASVPDEEAPKTAEPEEPAAIDEAPKTEEVEEPAAPVEEPAEEIAAPVEEVPKTEEKVSEVEPEATPVEAEPEAPKSEPVVEEEAPKSEPAVETPVEEAPVEEEETPVEAPKSEVVAPISEVKPATEGTLTFKAEEVTFNDKGVAFYNFDGSDASNPANDVHVSKRYSEFKALHAELTQQLADNQDEKTSDLPALPKASILQGRKNKKLLEDRKVQFTALLNAIAAHPVASQSDVFQAFLA
ncbi:hypothetical protein JG687_00003973 [Phytophthora cactorum]|uniref:PX domain-containing protein n=1 Tax=Phytophthora cactorum TaxID=29920 RepID=A0A329T1I1_9STRA|nr:hypothetical protein Pcac1_g23765 [Phytophthora cactorum]KAG2833155.1 hypothetical protein PC112_g6616 [Phytophthora cactorum]KAG2835567.1 hypothetical protein PC111_g5376 [Phytophthora cactorum]KAG2866471.1 hypothetical protein PC113_g2816 [Phytophthora cactorum]KAG2917634.1 hypothetical protein PC114_g7048 [Phytophthora cactorum]